MRARVRTINKFGRNTYFTTSSSVVEHLLAKAVYYIMIYPYYLMFKWCLYMPIKSIIDKKSKERKERKEEKI